MSSVAKKEKLVPAFIIGIAGATSSGKTITTMILSAIFEEAVTKGQTLNINQAQANSTVTVFAADDYFLPHAECPKRSFRPRVGDENIVRGYVNEQDKVQTSDRDCLSAVDWVRLHKDIKAFKDGTMGNTGTSGTASTLSTKRTSTHKAEAAQYRQIMASLVSPAEIQRLAAKVRDCISEQIILNMHHEFPGQLFKDAGDKIDLLNVRIAIVDGFLLFSREKPPTATATPLTPEHDQASTAQRLRSLTGSPKACHETISDNLLDARLYINVTPEMSCRRRFARQPYMDPPLGTRMPGQMWKTLGYYFDVARANFYAYDMLPDGMVKQLVQANLVEDALREILLKMKLAEQTARHRFLADRKQKKEMAEHQDDYNTMTSLITQMSAEQKEKEDMLQHQDDYNTMASLMAQMNLQWH